MQKRAQVTLFIIVGIILVVIISLFFVLTSNKVEESKQELPELSPVKDHVQTCFNQISKEAVYYIGMHGGYYHSPTASSALFFKEKVPFYFMNNKTLIPALKIVESELSNYIQLHLDDCIDFESFRNKSLIVNATNYNLASDIKEKSIEFTLKTDITVTKQNITSSLNEFKTAVDSNFMTLYSVSNQVLKIHVQNTQQVCLTCIEKLSNENNVLITAIPATNSTKFERQMLWITIRDNEFQLENKSYMLRFVLEK